jgi:hypothetical protein
MSDSKKKNKKIQTLIGTTHCTNLNCQDIKLSQNFVNKVNYSNE